MAPTAFHLITLNDSGTESSFLEAVRALPASERPVYLGRTQHWIHSPKLSSEALTGNGNVMQRWDYLMVNRASPSDPLAIQDVLSPFLDQQWSITKGVNDDQLDNPAEAKQRRASAPVPSLPAGWSPHDHSGLDAADPPLDLEASLGLSSYRLDSTKDSSNKPVLKDWVAECGLRHPGPVQMFNLLSYMPDGIPRYLQYIAAFTASVGSDYGGTPVFAGFDGTADWTSKKSENYRDGEGWEHVALVWYPSIWHFAKMLDDPAYAEVDRKFKQGALRDNPLICCTEIDI